MTFGKSETVSPWRLTICRAQVLDAVLEHGTNAATAQALGIAVKTLEQHLWKIYGCMEAHGLRLDGNTRAIALRAWMEWKKKMTRTIATVTLAVAPGEPDDPKRATKFDLTWWERGPTLRAADEVRTLPGREWGFCRKRLGVEGRELVGLPGDDPKVLSAIAGSTYYVFNQEVRT